ncbi:Protein RALF-like 19 [Glycine soja]
MNFKPWLSFLLLALALAMVAEASSVHHEYGFHGAAVVHDLIGDDNEMLLDSETNRRTLAGRQQYISYGALNANNVPCGIQSGSSVLLIIVQALLVFSFNPISLPLPNPNSAAWKFLKLEIFVAVMYWACYGVLEFVMESGAKGCEPHHARVNGKEDDKESILGIV